MEQLLLAYLDVGRTEQAQSLFQTLESAFRGSRIEILRGRIQEALGNYETALQVYTKQSQVDPTHPHLLQRIAMAHVAKGDRTKGIECLVHYVDTFAQDTEAWTVLATLYLQHGFYQHARFCYEELLLLQPKNHVFLLRYAELVYGLGQWEEALQYYCRVIEIVPDGLMAWYGIHYTTRSLRKAQRGDLDRYTMLHDLAKQQILGRTDTWIVKTFLQ
jgi:tetratricopeptide (TPR) repeat protein